jgi:hypothetical protein
MFYIVVSSSSGNAADMFKAVLDSNLDWTTGFSLCYDFPSDFRDKFKQKVLQVSKSSCICEYPPHWALYNQCSVNVID